HPPEVVAVRAEVEEVRPAGGVAPLPLRELVPVAAGVVGRDCTERKSGSQRDEDEAAACGRVPAPRPEADPAVAECVGGAGAGARIGAVSAIEPAAASRAASRTGTASRSRSFETANTTAAERTSPSAPPLLCVSSQPHSRLVAPPSAAARTNAGTERRAAI